MVLLVPPGQDYGELEKLLRPFNYAVWIAIISIYIFIGILVLLFWRFPQMFDFVIGIKTKFHFLTFSGLQLGISQPHVPQQRLSRFVLMIFILNCLILRSSYQGIIFKILISHDKKPPVNSINEMMEKNFFFYIYESLSHRLKDFTFYKR